MCWERSIPETLPRRRCPRSGPDGCSDQAALAVCAVLGAGLAGYTGRGDPSRALGTLCCQRGWSPPAASLPERACGCSAGTAALDICVVVL